MEIRCSKCNNNLKKGRIVYIEMHIDKDRDVIEKVFIMCTSCGRIIPLENVREDIIKELGLGDNVWVTK